MNLHKTEKEEEKMITSFNPQQSQIRQRQAFGTKLGPKVNEIIMSAARRGNISPERAASINAISNDGHDNRILDIVDDMFDKTLVLINEETAREIPLEKNRVIPSFLVHHVNTDTLEKAISENEEFNLPNHVAFSLSATLNRFKY